MADQTATGGTSRPGPTAPHRALPVLGGILPLDRGRLPTELLAGTTLAALGIPEVMGYAKIAGMPVVTGLYTILIPIAVFALLGSSRHLVVGADSATAAILAAGLAPLAAAGSPQYLALASGVALVTGAVLVVARIIRLGFLADFLSRSVLVGFLTGVGIQVAMGQVGGMFGVPSGSGRTIQKFLGTLGNLGDTNWPTLAVSLAVLAVILGARRIDGRIPGALIAVVGAIVVSWAADLATDGVSTLGRCRAGCRRSACRTSARPTCRSWPPRWGPSCWSSWPRAPPPPGPTPPATRRTSPRTSTWWGWARPTPPPA